jgi:hypothetical protein
MRKTPTPSMAKLGLTDVTYAISQTRPSHCTTAPGDSEGALVTVKGLWMTHITLNKTPTPSMAKLEPTDVTYAISQTCTSHCTTAPGDSIGGTHQFAHEAMAVVDVPGKDGGNTGSAETVPDGRPTYGT